ncbi:hypothetical protein B0T19DRAFT_409115 [Cercophora scortea]|uniref:Uncharacterized protein n=1 Tax=Cercophora scortea TaxID=314031 RepID=A0AAE0J4W8_9PEZI|nr:hypothetical protein B0T19DRAFT_409115 [Cercophora scortea]
MGVKRNRAKQAKKAGLRYNPMAKPPNPRGPRLRDVFPKAGMAYPYSKTITNHIRRDDGILSEIRVYVEKVTTANVQPLIVAMVDDATKMATAAGPMRGEDPTDFLGEVRWRDTEFPWTKKTSETMFRSFILCLRAARLNRRMEPLGPSNFLEPSPLARSLDAFNDATKAMAWGAMDSKLVKWLRYGGMMKGAEDEEDEEHEADMRDEAKPVDTEEMKQITNNLAAVALANNHSKTPAFPIPTTPNGNASNHNASAPSSADTGKPSRHYGVRSAHAKEIPTGDLDEILKKLRLGRHIDEMAQAFAKSLGLEDRAAEPLPCEDYIPLEDYSDEDVKDTNMEAQQENEMDLDSGDF